MQILANGEERRMRYDDQERELLTALRETEQKYKTAATEYKILLARAKDLGLLNPDLARLARQLLNVAGHVLGGRSFHISPLRHRDRKAPVSNREIGIHFDSLSPRENQTLCLLAQGMRPKEIARVLNLSPKTVDAHKTNAMRKLDVHSFADLLRLVISRESPERADKSKAAVS
jgi:DNA-binding CsgD family transcriptional regulator